MTEGILGLNVWMGEKILDDFLFLRKLKSICANTHVKTLTEETLKELLEHVKTILVTHPNEFVTIKELANNAAINEILEHNWNLHIDPDCVLMWYLCRPISFLSPYTLCLECRDHEDYGQWALMYNPDKEKRYQDQEEDFAMDSERKCTNTRKQSNPSDNKTAKSANIRHGDKTRGNFIPDNRTGSVSRREA